MVFAYKKIFKNKDGDIHIGANSPDGFVEATIEDVKKTLGGLKNRKLWRCTVCNDLCINITPHKICPTCFQEDVYVEINEKEFKTFLEI